MIDLTVRGISLDGKYTLFFIQQAAWQALVKQLIIGTDNLKTRCTALMSGLGGFKGLKEASYIAPGYHLLWWFSLLILRAELYI